MFGSKNSWLYFFFAWLNFDFNIGLVPGKQSKNDDTIVNLANLKPNEKMCDTYYNNYICNLRCNGKRSLCLGKDCFCQQATYAKAKLDEKSSEEFVFLKEKITQSVAVPENHLEEKPTLRHHIAHFCPDLEVARTCIRTCMKKGKPAFCGKDHICYCGHLYEHSDKNDTGLDLVKMYNNFHDLYKKYFGPNSKV